MAVTFSNSGTITFNREHQNQLSSGIFSLINEENSQQVYGSVFSTSGNSIDYTITGMHTSKDSYYANFAAPGYIGESKFCSGLSPTIPVYIEKFQGPYISESGTELLYLDFEDASYSGLDYHYYGTGITESGISSTPSGTVSGNYWSSITSTSTASMYITPSGTTTSGMLSGRTIFLTWQGTVSDSQAVGVAFLKQSAGTSGGAYKVYMHRNGTAQREIILAYGTVGNSSTGDITTAGVTLNGATLDFSVPISRDAIRGDWLLVEWEVDTTNDPVVKIGVSHKSYLPTDTIESVRGSATMVFQHISRGTTDGGGLYTTTVEPLSWLLTTNTSGRTAIDHIYVESGTVTKKGLFDSQLVTYSGTNVSGSLGRASVDNVLYNDGISTGPEGSILSGWPIYSIPKEDSIYGIRGYGYVGLGTNRRGGSSGQDVFSSYLIKGEGTAGIKHGVFRLAGKFDNASQPSIGFSILRQGPNFNDSCYTIEFYRSTTNAYNVRIRKGVVINTPFDATLDFGGTVQATSSAIPGLLDKWNSFWLEIRWSTDPTMNIEIKCKNIGYEIENSLVDRSPGNVDYALSSILSFTDNVSPYITTLTHPMLTLITSDNGIFIHRMELRRAKFGN